MIWVVDFPFCNFYSLERFLRTTHKTFSILRCDSALNSDDIVILPGVGTFAQGMAFLRSSNLENIVLRHALSGGCLIGICLGMQLLLQGSDESPGIKGLGLIKGYSHLIPWASSFHVPHIGWNELLFSRSSFWDFSGFSNKFLRSLSDYYFVHSYHAIPSDINQKIISFEHPIGLLSAAVATKNVIGFQFHPEKSGSSGYKLLDHVIKK